MRQIVETIEADAQSRPSAIEFEMAYQARVAIDRIRFAIKHAEQFARPCETMREVGLELLDASNVLKRSTGDFRLGPVYPCLIRTEVAKAQGDEHMFRDYENTDPPGESCFKLGQKLRARLAIPKLPRTLCGQHPQAISGCPRKATRRERGRALARCSRAWVFEHSNGRRRPFLPSVKLGKSVRYRPVDVDAFIIECERFSRRGAA